MSIVYLRSKTQDLLVSASPGQPLIADTLATGLYQQYEILRMVEGVLVPVDFDTPPKPTPPVPTPPPASNIDLDLATVTVIGSDRAVLAFPETATILQIGVRPNTMTLNTAGCENWPAVPVEDGGEAAQAGTLWVFEQITGQWYATGAERLRLSQLNGDKPEPANLSTWIGTEWLYDPTRWGVMSGYNPQPGEIVGFMVAAGSTRSDNNTPLHARSKVAMFRWPPGGGAWPVDILQYV